MPGTVNIVVRGKTVTLTHSGSSFKATRTPPDTKSLAECSVERVLAANFVADTRELDVSCLVKKKNKTNSVVVHLKGPVQDLDEAAAKEWATTLSDEAWKGVKTRRNLKVIVNPHSGIGKGREIFEKVVKPVIEAAGCAFDVEYTTHKNHAGEIAQHLPLHYDAVACVSGDGLIHEILNGFVYHDTPAKAFNMPLAPIPAGSGNGLAFNLLGLEEGADAALATLNLVRGIPMKVDVFSVTQGGKRSLSYMSQAVGLMADLDLGTENLRWMGDTRFAVGLLKGVIGFKACPVRLSYKAVEVDKFTMVETFRSRRGHGHGHGHGHNHGHVHAVGHGHRHTHSHVHGHKQGHGHDNEQEDEHDHKDEDEDPQEHVPLPLSESTEIPDGALPPLVHSSTDDEGWTTFDQPILYVYAGKGPYVSRTMMAFPMSLPNDGLIDILVHTASSRGDILKSLNGIEKGAFFWHSNMFYVKAKAYRIEPLSSKGNLSIDGEYFPFEDFKVECHKEFATLLSPFGHYAADFQAASPKEVR